VLTKWDGYWRKGADGQPLPYLDGLRSRLIPDTAVIMAEMKAGTLHSATSLAPADLATIKTNPDLEYVLVNWAPTRYFFGFNPEKAPFGKNLKLRQAAQYATDRVGMNKVLGQDAGIPDYFLGWVPGWSGYSDKMPKYELDADKAAALVKEAGFPNGADITLLHYTPSLMRRQAEMLQQMWSKAGIRVQLEPGDKAAARAKVKAGEFEMHMADYAPSPDPAFYSRVFTCDGSANWQNYCNKEVDKCMVDGAATYDPKERQSIYERCLRMIQEDGTLASGYFLPSNKVFNKAVKDLGVPWFDVDVRSTWLDK
jgi:ABC-type transport system substrate-binding protein